VYLYISGQRIVGCLVTEPIKTAHRVIPSSPEESHNNLPVDSTEPGKNGHTLEFGEISFKREIIRRHNHSIKNKEECQDPGAIICETEAVPALCGFRAIWVVPSRRRKRIASKLMDVARSDNFLFHMLLICSITFIHLQANTSLTLFPSHQQPRSFSSVQYSA